MPTFSHFPALPQDSTNRHCEGPMQASLCPSTGLKIPAGLVLLLPTVPILENSISQDKRGYPPLGQSDEDIMGLTPVCIVGKDYPDLLGGEPTPIEFIDIENWATQKFLNFVERLIRSSAQENYGKFFH